MYCGFSRGCDSYVEAGRDCGCGSSDDPAPSGRHEPRGPSAWGCSGLRCLSAAGCASGRERMVGAKGAPCDTSDDTARRGARDGAGKANRDAMSVGTGRTGTGSVPSGATAVRTTGRGWCTRQ